MTESTIINAITPSTMPKLAKLATSRPKRSALLARQYRRATYKEIGKFIIFDLIVERNLRYFASFFSLAWLPHYHSPKQYEV